MREEFAKSADVIEESEQSFLFFLVGTAITHWSYVEDSLVFILRILLRVRGDQAGVILYSITNFQVWLNVINELFVLAPEFATLRQRWNKIGERLRGIKDARDRLAHHAVYVERTDASSFPKTTIKPSSFDLRQKSRQFRPLTREEVRSFIEKTRQLHSDIMDLAEAMAEQLESSLKKSVE